MKIRELFKTRKNWTQHFMARGKNGNGMASNSTGAVSWCLFGAIYKCYSRDSWEPFTLEGEKVHKLLMNRLGNIVDWNNNPKRKFSEVKKLVTELNI